MNVTAADAAALHLRADTNRCTWAVDPRLPKPFLVDSATRTVWVDGRLSLDRAYEAIAAGLDQLGCTADANVIPFPHRAGRKQQSGAG